MSIFDIFQKKSCSLTNVAKELIGIKFTINSPSIAKAYAANEINQRLNKIFRKKREIKNIQNNKSYKIGNFFKSRYNKFDENSIYLAVKDSS